MFILLCYASTTEAQHIRLLTPDSLPAASVCVVLSANHTGNADLVLVSDADGKVLLPEAGYPFQLRVGGMYFEEMQMVLSKPEFYTILLAVKELIMRDVVVSGQYAPVSTDKAVHRIEVIDRKKIDAMAAQTLRDVMTNQLEVRISNDAIFGTSMGMQGSQAYGADPKILIDGVPVTGKQNGAVDLSQINLANVERIEIIKGPMSVSYGTDAIAGTVNLITKRKIKRSAEVGASTYFESIGTYNLNFTAGVRNKHHAFVFDGFRNFFAGWQPDLAAAFLDFSKRPADSFRVTLWKPRAQYQGCAQYSLTTGKTSYSYKGAYFYELITSRGRPLEPYNEMAFDNYFHTWRKDNALFINSDLGKDSHLTFLAAFNAYKRVKQESVNDLTTLSETFTDAAQDTSKYSEVNSRAAYTTNRAGASLNFEVGYDANIQYANSTQIKDREQHMGNYAVHGSLEFKPLDRLTIRPGLRYGYNTRYVAPLVPSANLLFCAWKNWKLRTSFARGFRQPGLKELYFDFVDVNHNIQGNSSLKSEFSNNYSLSADNSYVLGAAGFKVNFACFYNDVRDRIVLIATQGAANEYLYMNADKFRTKGIQAGIEYAIRSVTLSGGFSVTGLNNYFSELSDFPGYTYSPEARGSAMFTFEKYGVSLSLFYKYTGRSSNYVRSGTEILLTSMDGYHTGDITFSKLLFRRQVNIATGCKNFFDVKNVAANQLQGAHNGGGSLAAIGTGRYYFLKVGLNISK